MKSDQLPPVTPSAARAVLTDRFCLLVALIEKEQNPQVQFALVGEILELGKQYLALCERQLEAVRAELREIRASLQGGPDA